MAEAESDHDRYYSFRKARRIGAVPEDPRAAAGDEPGPELFELEAEWDLLAGNLDTDVEGEPKQLCSAASGKPGEAIG